MPARDSTTHHWALPVFLLAGMSGAFSLALPRAADEPAAEARTAELAHEGHDHGHGFDEDLSRGEGAAAEAPYLTVLLIDGLHAGIHAEEMAAGRLPELRRLAAQGVTIRRGIGAFPSMTGVAYYPFLTGDDAARSGIAGLRWFDRARARGLFRNYVGRSHSLLNADLRTDVPTLFERFGDRHSFAINSLLDRGAKRAVTLGVSFTAAKYRDRARWLRPFAWLQDRLPGPNPIPDLETLDQRVVDRAIADLERRPKVQWVSLTTPDSLAHLTDDEGAYRETLRHVDAQIGRYRAASERLGLERDRIYAVVSDHGVTWVRRNVDLCRALEAQGVPCWRGKAAQMLSARLNSRTRDFERFGAVLAVNGNTLNHLYFRDPAAGIGAEAWRAVPATARLRTYPAPRAAAGQVDLPRFLAGLEPVEFAIVRGPSTVEIHARDGVGRILRAGDEAFAYAFEGRDPLGYADDPRVAPLLDGRAHAAAEWLAATAHTDFPYAPVRVARLMARPQAGDVVVTARAGFDLAADYEPVVKNYRGGHGGLRADQLAVPLILAGPGVARGAELEAATAEDVGATLLRLLDQVPTDGALGRPLDDALAPR
jgi:hypothetical protein